MNLRQIRRRVRPVELGTEAETWNGIILEFLSATIHVQVLQLLVPGRTILIISKVICIPDNSE